jgi:putative ABC transport system permease protein
VAVVAEQPRRELLGAAGGVGSWIRIDGLPFQVVGVLSRVGTQLWQDGPSAIDEEVWVPITALFAFGPRWGHDGDIVDMIALRLIDRRAYDDLGREIRAVLAPRLGVSVTDEEAIRIASPIESLRKLPMDEMDGLLFTLGAGTLLIGGVGVLTMMLDAVHDRRQEIGVRLAVGARRRDVLGQFLLETAVIAGLGGLLGLVLGIGGCWALARIEVPDLVPQPILRGDVVAVAFGVLVTVALGAGFLPAWRASRVDPSITLRAE